MQIQLNTDSHIPGRESLANWVQAELKDKLARFGDHITRIEVHLSDTNAARAGEADVHCKLEARLAGRAPVTVGHDAAQVGEAFPGATDKLQRKLDTVLGRARDGHGRDSIRGDSAE